MRSMKFNPSLSFDGIAFIAGIIGMSIYVGMMRADIERSKQDIHDLTSIVTMQSQSITRLQAIVETRDKR